MSAPTPKADGTVQYGSRVLTIGSAAGGAGGVVYVAENITVNRPTKTIEQTNEIDAPSDQTTYLTFITGACTLQLGRSSTAEPQMGFEFTVTFDVNWGSEVFYLADVSRAESQGSAKKLNVTFRKKINVWDEAPPILPPD